MVTPELTAVLDRLLAKSPEDRLKTPGELANLMLPFVEGANLAALVHIARETDRRGASIGYSHGKRVSRDRPRKPKLAPTGSRRVVSPESVTAVVTPDQLLRVADGRRSRGSGSPRSCFVDRAACRGD